MMPDPQPPIEEFLYSMDMWTIDENNNFIIESFDGRGDLDQYIYTDSDFDKLHPKLANAVRALSEWNWESRGNKSVYGSDIRNTLDYLIEKVVRFRDCVHQNRIVIALKEVSPTTHLPGYLMLIEGDDLDVRVKEVDGLSVEFIVSRESNRKIHVEKHELEKQYSGWESRYNTSLSLGLTTDEMVAYVFENVPAPADLPSISTVTFDEHDL